MNNKPQFNAIADQNTSEHKEGQRPALTDMEEEEKAEEKAEDEKAEEEEKTEEEEEKAEDDEEAEILLRGRQTQSS